jgi:ankyrin repeat protein
LIAFPALAPFIVRELERVSRVSVQKECQADALTQLALCASVGYGRARNDDEAWCLIQKASQADSFRGMAIAARLWALCRSVGSKEELAKLKLWLTQGAETGSHYAFQDLQSLFPDSLMHASDPYAMPGRLISVESEESEHPLILACRLGDFNHAKDLLEACDGTIPKGRYGDTPLHWLASFPEDKVEDFAERVVEKGVNVHARTHLSSRAQRTPHYSFEDPNGATALKWAISRDARIAVRVLIQLGALPDFVPQHHDERRLVVTENPLCWSVHFQSIGCVEMLCEQYGIKLINQFDVTYKSPFYYAVAPDPFHHIRHLNASDSQQSKTRTWKQERIISILISNGSNLQMVLNQSFGCLHLAAMKDVDTLRILLRLPECRGMISQPDQQGVTPLANAITSGHMDCFKELIANGADQSKGNVHYKIHAISFCCYWPTNTTLEIAKELIKRDPKCVNSVEIAGTTPLHRAAANGAVEIATLLLDHGAKLMCYNEAGLTPLAVAIASRSVPSVELLCQKHKKEKKELLAFQRGNTSMSALEFLLAPGAQSDLASQMGFGGDPGCLDVPFSSTSTKIFNILLDTYDRKIDARPATYWGQMAPRCDFQSGILSAIRTANFDVVNAITKSGQFSIDTQEAVIVALRQFSGNKSYHIASEPDRRRMLKKMQDLRRTDFENQMNQRVQRRGLGPLWKAYYFIYASLAEEQYARWISDQQNYPSETTSIATLQGVASFRLELHPILIYKPWQHFTVFWYLAHLAVFVPYWLFLARAMRDPLAQVSVANKINIAACVLIVCLSYPLSSLSRVYKPR